MSELKWNWVYYPYLDNPNEQEESALKAGYIKVVIKDEADKVIAEKDAEIEKLKQEIERLKQEKFVIEQYKPIQPIKLLKPRIMENGCEYYLAGEVRMCIEQAARQIAESNSVYKELDTIIKHQKYKRCLAMAKWCEYFANYWECCEPPDCFAFIARAKFHRKWHKRWLELAEKFKEAK